MAAKRQHHKGKKRPRAWHMGRSQGKVNERLMKTTIEPAFAAAEADREVVKATAREHREKTGDWQECLRQVERAAPHVPSWDFNL